MENITVLGVLALLAMPCFIPTIIAGCRAHASGGTIFTLNVLTFTAGLISFVSPTAGGLALIGWVTLFIWACAGSTRRDREARDIERETMKALLARLQENDVRGFLKEASRIDTGQ